MKRWQKYFIVSITLGNLILGAFKSWKNWNSNTPSKDSITRVASLALASDEILVDILRESQELKKLIAISTLADNKEYSFLTEKITQKIQERSNSNLEKLIALKPDLVVATSFNRLSLVNILKQAGIQILNLSQFNSLEDLYKNYRVIGKALHREQESERLIFKMDKELGSYYEDLKNPVKTLIWFPDGTVIGHNTLLNDILTLVGGENVLEKKLKGWIRPNLETLSNYKPRVILSVCEDHEKKDVQKKIEAHPILKSFEKKLICLTKREFSTQSAHILKTAKKLNQRLHDKEQKKSS